MRAGLFASAVNTAGHWARPGLPTSGGLSSPAPAQQSPTPARDTLWPPGSCLALAGTAVAGVTEPWEHCWAARHTQGPVRPLCRATSCPGPRTHSLSCDLRFPPGAGKRGRAQSSVGQCRKRAFHGPLGQGLPLGGLQFPSSMKTKQGLHSCPPGVRGPGEPRSGTRRPGGQLPAEPGPGCQTPPAASWPGPFTSRCGRQGTQQPAARPGGLLGDPPLSFPTLSAQCSVLSA